MEELKKLNDLREELKIKENKLVTDIYMCGEEEKLGLLRKCKKNRKNTEKMIFALIEKI